MDKKAINGVRQYYQLPENITDDQIAKNLKHSLGEAVVNLDIAKKNLATALKETMPKIYKKLFKAMNSLNIKY